jgi:aspartyl-tRNA(Asn)/glutamyl-tRNA(Gln) amidotransferase subunit B
LKTLHTLLRYIDICDGNMQEGSFRCDANVSVRPKGQKEFGTRAEIKNVNSFRFVEKAINYEVERQIALLERGEKIVQETRLYDADKNETRSMRSKEEAHDYRYFPDPDLLPLVITTENIQKILSTLPELPEQKRLRLMHDFDLTPYDASNLVMTQALANYFENVFAIVGKPNAKLAANWIMGDLSASLNKFNLEITNSPVTPKQLSELLMRISDNTISGKIAKTVFEALWENGGDADTIIAEKGLKQVTDTGAIEAIIQQVIDNNPTQLADYRSGKDKLFGFFVGEVMKLSRGKANPKQVNDLLKEKLQ